VLAELNSDIWLFKHADMDDPITKDANIVAWRKWRQANMNGAIDEVAQKFRDVKKKGKVALLTSTAAVAQDPLEQVNSLETPLDWLQSLTFDEFVVRWNVTDQSAARCFGRLADAVERSRSRPSVTIMPDVGDDESMFSTTNFVDAIGDREVTSLAIRVHDPDSLKWSSTFWNGEHADDLAMLSRKDLLALKSNNKLDVYISLELENATIGEVLDALQNATKLGFDVAPGHRSRLAYRSLSVQNARAWSFMQDMALQTGGIWRRTKAGYEFEVTATPDPSSDRPNHQGLLVALGISSLTVIILGMVYVARRRRGTSQPK